MKAPDRRMARAWMTLAAWLVPAATVLAQKPSHPAEQEGSLVTWAIAFGIMVVVGFSAFLNPKRSHLN